ncbi:MAG: hypothetical protein ABIA74_04230 [bacterium]
MNENDKKIKEENIKDSMQEAKIEIENEIKKQTDDQKKETSLEELTEQAEKEGKKLINVKELDSETMRRLGYSLTELVKLRNEVIEKIQTLASQKETLDKKVHEVKKTGKIKFNEEDEKKSLEGVQYYMYLLQNILGEISQQLQYFALYYSDKKPEKIIVPKNESDDFGQYISNQVKSIGRYVKNVRKNLNIIFSRYQVNFKSQVNNLDYLQSYLKIIAKEEKNKKQ